jgi:cholest-4-en-3-one 26-monooxygenase
VMTERMCDMTPSGEISRLRSSLINGLKHMPVRFTPSAPRARVAH